MDGIKYDITSEDYLFSIGKLGDTTPYKLVQG